MLLSNANNNYIERKSWESPLHMLCTSLAANRRVCAGFQQIVNKAYTLQGFVFVSIRRRDPITGFWVQGFGFFSIRRRDPITGFRVQGFEFVSIRREDQITGFRVQGFGFVSIRRGDPLQDLGFKDLQLCPRRGDPTTGFRVQGFAKILHFSPFRIESKIVATMPALLIVSRKLTM
jgi:hypothetical protein